MIADCRSHLHGQPRRSSSARYNRAVRWRLIVIGTALVALLMPLPSRFVEGAYSSTVFPSLQALVTTASNRTAWPWLDMVGLAVVLACVLACVRDLMMGPLRAASLRVAGRVVTLGASAYLIFLAMWGLNYRREPLTRRVGFDAGRISSESATRLARETVAQLNALHTPAHRAGWAPPHEIDADLATSFHQTEASLGLGAATVLGRPKHSLLDLYFRRAGVAGMTDPFFLETLVASDLLPFERPHVVAHEWAHLAGITDEGEANFVGWLTCVRGDASARYSGWLFLYSDVLSAVPGRTARDIQERLDPGPREDLAEIRARYTREVDPRVSTAGWTVYDQYLKANRIEAGTASYAEVVRLILGTGLR
jgi:hypothetical protein